MCSSKQNVGYGTGEVLRMLLVPDCMQTFPSDILKKTYLKYSFDILEILEELAS